MLEKGCPGQTKKKVGQKLSFLGYLSILGLDHKSSDNWVIVYYQYLDRLDSGLVNLLSVSEIIDNTDTVGYEESFEIELHS